MMRVARMTFHTWRKYRPNFIGAALAYYVIFSVAPILVFTTWILGSIFGEQAARGTIVTQLQYVVGQDAAKIIEDIVHKATSGPSSWIATFVSVPMLLFGSTMVFFQLRDALNTIWDVDTERKRGGFTGLLINYAFSAVMIVVVEFLLMLIMLKGPALGMAREYLETYLSFTEYVTLAVDLGSTFLLVFVLFAAIYKILPQTRIEWFDVWAGAGVTAFLFLIAQVVIAIYVRVTDVATAYGAIGSITVLLIWLFYSTMSFLFGAAFTRVYAREYGSLSDGKKNEGSDE